MGTVLICLILAVIVAFSLNSVRRRIRYGSSCCGTHDPLPKKIRVTDKDASHYPYSYRLIVDGMHCSNCVRHVENALNAKDGVWATVKLEDKSVLLRSKSPQEEKELSQAIAGAGYTMLNFSACG
ncbi:MAG: heavy-metal-associated domain-containing protein [Treponema sp.]|nr:cation transporter [Treponema sp.]MCR5623348.1 heavy-metal-associated domain-containing protein [Treponema sp.]